MTRALTRGMFRSALFASMVLISKGVQALITGGYGNDPLSDRDWPEGTLGIANILPVGDRRPAVESSEPVIICMVQTTSVTVSLTGRSGRAIAGQMVHLAPIGNPVGKWSGSGTTDDKGRAVIEGVPPGEYRITDRAYEATQSKEIRVEEGRAIETTVDW